MSTDADDPDAEGGEAPETPEDGADDPEPETTDETPADTPDEGDDDGQPTIEDGEQAAIPEGLADVDPAEVEEAAGASADEEADESGEDDADGDETATDPDAMGDGDSGASPAQAGELYVTVVRSITNANIKKFGGEDAGQVDRDHFEQYDLAEHFNATMDQMGVGSDMAPHEALLLATLLSVGDGLASETDAMDRLMGQMMDKAMGNGGSA